MTKTKLLKPTEIDILEFTEKLMKVNRVWDGQLGLAINQALHYGIDIVEEMDVVFIRDDGWSIATSNSNYDSCFNLWPDDWVEIYTCKS